MSSEITTPAPTGIRLSLGKKLLFALITVVIFFVGLEFGLGFAGLGKPEVLGELQFGYTTGIPVFDEDGIEYQGQMNNRVPLFEEDATLFWKPIASTRYTGTRGFRRPEPPSRFKPASTYRLLVLSDSCSFLGKELYPNRFAKRLADVRGRPVDVVNASCPGYTSFQGKRRAEALWEWKPDLVLIYFGWNDHWKSLNGLTDAQVVQRREYVLGAKNWLHETRIYRTAGKLVPLLTAPRPVEDYSLAPVRVPLDDYRANLEAMVEAAQEHDIPTLMITAPSGYREGAMPEWSYGFFQSFYKMSKAEVDAVPGTHKAYCDIVREIASAHDNAHLVDAQSKWRDETVADRFRRDQIHLTEAGHEALATMLMESWNANLNASNQGQPRFEPGTSNDAN